MRNRRAGVYLAGALLLSVVLLAGCGKESEHGLSAKNPVHITMWHYYNGVQENALNELIDQFNDTVGEEKGIVVSAESKGGVSDLAEAVEESMNSKVGADPLPDILQCYPDTATEIEARDLLVNLDDYVSEDIKEQYIDAFIEEGILGEENQWKIFPVAKSTEVLMVNKTDWDKFAAETGYDTDILSTWEGITQVAEAYYNWSNGASFFGRDSFANYMIVGSTQLGEEIFQVDNGQLTLDFNKNAMKTLWDNYYIPYVSGYYTHMGRYRSDDVKLGEIIALVCSTSSSAYFPSEVSNAQGETYPIDYMVLPLPNFANTENYAVQQGAGMSVIKSDETKEYASVVFLEWFTEADNNMEFSMDTGYLPVRKDACTLEAYENYLSTSDNDMTELEKDVMRTALKQIEDYNLYAPKGFESSYEARNIVGETMIDLALADRAEIEERIANGEDRETVLKEYLTDAYFDEWFLDTQAQLEECCN